MVKFLKLFFINSFACFHICLSECLFVGLPVSIYFTLPSSHVLLDVTHNTTEGQSIIKETSKLVPELSTLMNGK